MSNNLDVKKIFNGTDGAVWITTETEEVKVGSMKTFSLKQTNTYEDIDVSESMTKKRKLIGVELSGELTKFKIAGLSFVCILFVLIKTRLDIDKYNPAF